MTQESTAAAEPPRPRSRAFFFSQLCALPLAIYLGWHSYEMVDASALDLYRALLWIAAALVMLAYFAWDGSLPHLTTWPRAIIGYVKAHPVELLLLLAIFAIGVLVRLFRYGSLPPNGYVFMEEHIAGGVGWEILHGDRRFAYPIVMYSGALGQWLFGPSTLGLRSMTIAASIVVIIPFYLLMREVVDRPAALFATALFASLRAFQDTGAELSQGELVTVVMAWTFLCGLRTRNAIWFIPMAACAAEVCYEYETFKALPFLALPFVGFVALRATLWPLPTSAAALWTRTRELAPRAIKPVIVTTVVVLIGIGPMIAQTHRGQHIFFSSLERQEADRTDRGTSGLFSPDAKEQLKESVEVYTPFVSQDFPLIGPVPIRGVIDDVTSLMIWASVIVALLTFWRGARAFFMSWFVGGLLVASLLLSNFDAWKVVGFLIPAVVLIGFLADDIFALAKRRSSRFVFPTFVACGAIVVAVLVLNLRTLNANADDPNVVKEWGNTQSQLYALCDHLRSRPADNFSYVTQRVRDTWGFSTPPGDRNERVAAWSDWKFVCWGLQGESIGSLQEAWPLYRNVDGPVSLTTVGLDYEMPDIMDSLKQVIPDLGPPDRNTTAPGGLFKLLSYAVTSSQLNERRGLALSHIAPDGSKGASSVAGGPSFELPHQAGADAFTLSGLVYAPQAMDASFTPDGAAGAPTVAITIDGQPSYDAVSAPGVETPQQLLQGWHLVQIRGYAPADAALKLRWHTRDGASVATGQDDFYAVDDLAAWRHTRTLTGTRTGESVRFDFHPHFMAFDGLRIDATHLLPPGAQVSRDVWDARWTVAAAGTYTMMMNAPGQKVRLTIDGKDVITSDDPNGGAKAVDVPLTAGDHTVELVFTDSANRFIGGILTVKDGAGNPVTMKVHPF
jgi:hypothetical protein